MRTKEEKKGISLIVLVITIIVIIILAVSVILSISNNNPIENARKARFLSDLRTIQEEVTLYEASQMADKYSKGESYTRITVSGDTMVGMFPTTKEYSEKIHIVDGQVILITDKISEQEKIWASEIGIGHKDEVVKEVTIPTGFKYLEGTVDRGYVIVNETDGNEFVWVPVDIPEGKTFEEVFVSEDGLDMGEVQNWVSSKLVTDVYTSNQEEQIEYNAMKESVKKYGGFYIGRYETSSNSNGEPQIKANEKPWNYIQWGKSMTDSSGGAVEKSRNLYPAQAAKNEKDAVSILPYGVQWDSIVRWLEINYSGIGENSTSYGNYESEDILKTASNPSYNTNNIYDICR